MMCVVRVVVLLCCCVVVFVVAALSDVAATAFAGVMVAGSWLLPPTSRICGSA